VVASLNPSHLTQFYDKIDLGSPAAISLIGSDGVVKVPERPERIFWKVSVRDRSAPTPNPPPTPPLEVQVSRRFLGPDGRFGGVVVASLNPSHLTQFYDKMKVPERPERIFWKVSVRDRSAPTPNPPPTPPLERTGW
jgi:hypothetical protein